MSKLCQIINFGRISFGVIMTWFGETGARTADSICQPQLVPVKIDVETQGAHCMDLHRTFSGPKHCHF